VASWLHVPHSQLHPLPARQGAQGPSELTEQLKKIKLPLVQSAFDSDQHGVMVAICSSRFLRARTRDVAAHPLPRLSDATRATVKAIKDHRLALQDGKVLEDFAQRVLPLTATL
jgi:hypothetical protein